jgi:2-methylcitrate dehydratase PrpD
VAGVPNKTDSPTTLAGGLFEFALSTRIEDLPAEVLHGAALRLIDTVGAGLASAALGYGTAASQIVLSEPAGGKASVWASNGAQRPAAAAAFANGMLSHGMDYDDTNTRATLHPGVVVVPTVLAVAEEAGSSGHEVLAAVAIGYEIASRLGELTPGDFQRHGFHPSAVLGIFGATAAAARLMGATYEHAVSAAGLAGSMAAGLMEYLADGSDAKQMHPGWVAQGAVRAVQLAQHGVTGPATVLEGGKGIYKSYVDADVDISLALTDLGKTWTGLDVATKPYAACHAVHAAVDSWRQIRDSEGLTDSDTAGIRKLTGLVPSWYLQLVCDPLEEKRRPRSTYEARFSLPYALGRVVVDGKLDLDSFSDDKLTDSRVLEVAAKVDYEVVEYPEFPAAFPGGLRVEMVDGRTFETEIRHNLGSVGNPMTDPQIHSKLLDSAAKLSEETEVGQELLASLLSLEQPDSSIARFTKAIASLG